VTPVARKQIAGTVTLGTRIAPEILTGIPVTMVERLTGRAVANNKQVSINQYLREEVNTLAVDLKLDRVPLWLAESKGSRSFYCHAKFAPQSRHSLEILRCQKAA